MHNLYDAIGDWCRRGGEPELDVLQSLQLPAVPALDDALAEAGEPVADQNTFPDPTAANVFWIQDIVRDLPLDAGPALSARYLQAKLP